MKTIFQIIVLFYITQTLTAQTWQWGKSGGSISSLDNENEDITALETDSQGNVYYISPTGSDSNQVAGNAMPSYGYTDYTIGSFSCDGAYRWSTVVGGRYDDKISAMHVDANGDVYVTIDELTYATDQFDVLTHFDATTTLPIIPTDVSRKRLFLVKYSGTTGAYLWRKAIQADGLTTADYSPESIPDFCLDPDGTSYLLCKLLPGLFFDGQFNNTMAGKNHFIAKLSPSGNFISAVYINMTGPATSYYRKKYSLKKSTFNGNYYIAGELFPVQETASFGGQTVNGSLYIASFDSTGAFLWLKTDTNGIGTRGLTDFYIHPSGDLYFTGGLMNGNSFGGYLINNSGNSSSTLLAFRLDSFGNVIWGSNASLSEFSISSKSILVKGNEVAILPTTFNGFTWGSQSFPLTMNLGAETGIFFLNKDTGVPTGHTKLSSTFGNAENGSYLATDSYGSYYVGGSFEYDLVVNSSTTLLNEYGETDFFIAKYGSNNCNLAVQDQPQNEKPLLYPNPAQNEIYINAKNSLEYVIYNIQGKKVQHGTIIDSQTPVSVTNLTNGTYIIQLQNLENKEVQHVKFIKG